MKQCHFTSLARSSPFQLLQDTLVAQFCANDSEDLERV